MTIYRNSLEAGISVYLAEQTARSGRPRRNGFCRLRRGPVLKQCSTALMKA
jgi:hypothetical protein